MSEFSPWAGLIGGAMLGAAAGALVLLSGRVAGISGIVAGSFRARGIELGWRAAFIVGLVLGPLVVALVVGAPVVVRVPASAMGLVVAGLLVGFGARLGGGCTSGHGVCGISRLSPRSLVATVVFVAAGITVVFAVRHVLEVPTWP
ncbi:MAG: YeeE/YedE family protein [Alphaproteobacteria bacterium]